jgi:phenylacetic acid degradation operon negative regulatory protein
MSDEIWKTVLEAPIRNLIYSCLSAYGEKRGGELPGPWFSRVFKGIGHAPSAVRLALYRMVKNSELESRKHGRVNSYRLAPFGRAGIEAGLQMLLGEPEKDWDGAWTIVHFHFTSEDRFSRDHMRGILTLEGFGCLGPGLYIHPRDRGTRILRAMESSAGISVFRGPIVGGRSDEELVEKLWDLENLNRRYEAFLREARSLGKQLAVGLSDRKAFFFRIGVVLHFLGVGWSDPEIPDSLLPPGWLGYEARESARRLYEALVPRTLAHGDDVMQRLNDSGVIPPRVAG